MSRHVHGLAALVATLGCSTADVGQSEHAIVNGVDSDDAAVVALVVDEEPHCSGTLVTPHIVITAAHCLPPYQTFDVSSLSVFFGSEVGGQGERINAVLAYANPLWTVETIANDIGVVVLERPASAKPIPMLAQPLEMALETLEDARGVGVVGFGITERDGDGSGRRRSGAMTIAAIDDHTIHLNPGPSATCNGDSGGALLLQLGGVEFLAGVHSRSNCEDLSLGERVDVHARSFVLAVVESIGGAPECGSDGLCAAGCATPDPDCLCGDDDMCTSECAQPEADPDCERAVGCNIGRGSPGALMLLFVLALLIASRGGRQRVRAIDS